MNTEERFDLITRNLQEVIDKEHLMDVLNSRNPIGYWGTAPTGSIHIGYLCPFLKLRDIVNAGCELTILIADIHAFLDNLKTPYEKIQARSKYYIEMIKIVLNTLGVDLTKIKFVLGSEFQLKPEMTLELFKLASITKISEATKAGTEVVKQTKDPFMTSLLYPLLQALDEHFLKVDFEIGGVDQRKIFTYGRDFLPEIGIKRRFTHLMNKIVPGLSTTAKDSNISTKMCASNISTKIDIIDSPESIKKKISKTYCLDGDAEDNSPLGVIENLVFPLVGKFVINRNEKYGGNITFDTFSSLKEEVAKGSKNGGIHPSDLKSGLTDFFINFLKPIREHFLLPENNKLVHDAYD